MKTYKGHLVDFNIPSNTTIDIDDIKFALSNIRRYNGHLDWPLLKHLVLCVCLAQYNDYTDEEVAYCAAHDIHEIYVGDMVSTLKPFVPEFVRLEKNFEYHVHDFFNLDNWCLSENKCKTKWIDLRALCLEMTLFPDNRFFALRIDLFPNLSFDEEEIQILHSIKRLSNEDAWEILSHALLLNRTDLKERYKIGQQENRTTF